MSPLVPLMLFGWIPLTIILFFYLKPHRAVIFSVIGGCLLLPTYGYNLPGIPGYGKATAITLGLILGGRLSGKRQRKTFDWKLYDLPMLIFCLCPIATSLNNGLGIYDGLSSSFGTFMMWGGPYFAARIYFDTKEKLHELCLGIVIGGLIYLPLCLFEIRMSPKLNKIFYGYFPHDWGQHKRYGGWRPIVFMQHGLMVSLWMANTTIVAFWLLWSRSLTHLKRLPMQFIVPVMIITTILCKSANAWSAIVIGSCFYFIHSQFRTNFPFLLLILIVFVYPVLRIFEYASRQEIELFFVHIFDAERVGSLMIRLYQEDLFTIKAMERPFLGWGGFSRGWPIEPMTGERLVKMIDSLWLIFFSKYGFVGLTSFFSSLLIGPWLVFRSNKQRLENANIDTLVPVVLSVVVVLFMLDCLFNGMVNQVYILTSGALVSWYLTYNSPRGN